MALPETRYLVRMTLSDTERNVHAEVAVNASRHPSETLAYLHLRILAYALSYTETLAFGPGLCEPEAPTLLDRDPTGDVIAWIACGSPDVERLVRGVRKNSRAKVSAFFGDPKKHARLLEEAAGNRELRDVDVWLLAPELFVETGRTDVRRSTWSVTVVDGHLYLDVDGKPMDSAYSKARIGDLG